MGRGLVPLPRASSEPWEVWCTCRNAGGVLEETGEQHAEAAVRLTAQIHPLSDEGVGVGIIELDAEDAGGVSMCWFGRG
jgi:hypothetical protein